jgi:glycosyltransferase involved in cell wall biosynthesis
LRIETERSLWRRVRVLREAIAGVNPDVMDGMLGWDITYGAIAATLCRVPLIISELQNERRAIRETYPWTFRLLERLALQYCCDHIVCCSEGVRASYRPLFSGFASKARVIHDALEPPNVGRDDAVAARRSFGIPEDALLVATLGRFCEQKDHATFVRMAGRVLRRRPDALFAIGGYGHLEQAIREQIASAGLENRVLLLGEITNPGAFYAMSDVFVLTSRWEGFPVVLLEALACARAVVSTNVGGIAEMITSGETGLLCEAGDEVGLANAVVRLLDDMSERRRLGEAGRERVLSRFSIATLVKQWEHVYSGTTVPVSSATTSRVSQERCALHS